MQRSPLANHQACFLGRLTPSSGQDAANLFSPDSGYAGGASGDAGCTGASGGENMNDEMVRSTGLHSETRLNVLKRAQGDSRMEEDEAEEPWIRRGFSSGFSSGFAAPTPGPSGSGQQPPPPAPRKAPTACPIRVQGAAASASRCRERLCAAGDSTRQRASRWPRRGALLLGEDAAADSALPEAPSGAEGCAFLERPGVPETRKRLSEALDDAVPADTSEGEKRKRGDPSELLFASLRLH